MFGRTINNFKRNQIKRHNNRKRLTINKLGNASKNFINKHKNSKLLSYYLKWKL